MPAERAFKYKPNDIEKVLVENMVKTGFYYRIINLGDENTTREEQEMEFLRAYLQDGYTLEEAEKLAKQRLKDFLEFVEYAEKESQMKKGEG
ncbi:hypothetical protein QI155_10610 [Thermodesulfovibrio sp. 1176]|uniref:hypothetical protein n=1 Tax=Thermodesulfovibrio sp. 1176 TaxID=3043424 RepID=UPI002482E7A8|nr:hypothetical protein [Thermodesulfovibrio sp. 1176]MDI1472983.1 hypothetical protein [Thermodesulfovibrio sp. 1176]